MKHNIAFSLVAYRHELSDITPLLLSVTKLNNSESCLSISLFIYEAMSSGSALLSINSLSSVISPTLFEYFNGKNIGYGSAHNFNFQRISLSDPFYFIVVNPDISFEPTAITRLVLYASANPAVSCIAPLIYLYNGNVQFSAKKNVTFFSLLLGRFSFLKKFPLAKNYDQDHKNLIYDYKSQTFASSYLSGCFLCIPSSFYRLICGFDPRFFLHLEDADIVRRLAMHGQTIHFHKSIVIHGWARGSHSSFRQMFYLVKSYITYVGKWGFSFF